MSSGGGRAKAGQGDVYSPDSSRNNTTLRVPSISAHRKGVRNPAIVLILVNFEEILKFFGTSESNAKLANVNLVEWSSFISHHMLALTVDFITGPPKCKFGVITHT